MQAKAWAFVWGHVSRGFHGLGKLKLGKNLAESAENAEMFGKLKLGITIPLIAFLEHRKTRKTQICKLKLEKTLAEIAENADYLLAQGLFSRRYL